MISGPSGLEFGATVILSGSKIIAAHICGDIAIDPFEPRNVNPNSYNYRLGPQLIERFPEGETSRDSDIFSLPQDGYILQSGRLYLGATYERIGSERYVITLLGRSSLGRLGLYLNATADMGHVGCRSHWTLELSVIQPLRVYPGMRIGQVAFWRVTEADEKYRGRYFRDTLPASNKDATLGRPLNGEDS